MQTIFLGQEIAAQRRVFFTLVDATDGFSPELAEAGGQPNYSLNGAYVGNTAAVLVVVDAANQPGVYYVTLTAAEILAPGRLVVRYKSANTRECAALVDIMPPPATYIGTVVADGANTSMYFKTNLGALSDLRDSCITMLTGTNVKQPGYVVLYNGGTGFITITPTLAFAPVAGDTFMLTPFAFNGLTALQATLLNTLENVRLAGGLAFRGTVINVPGANQFDLSVLSGMGNNYFSNPNKPYEAFVLWDAAGAGAAPQGERRIVTAFVGATGRFTTLPFSVAVGVGDDVIILHPSVAIPQHQQIGA